MTQIQNVTKDHLGWQGHLLPAGQVVEVPNDVAATMLAQCPDKFVLAPVAATGSAASTGPAATPPPATQQPQGGPQARTTARPRRGR